MQNLLHIYRNTPVGRETLLQSIYFCKLLNIELNIYIPEQKQFLIYFKNNIVTVAMDGSYIKHKKNAKENVIEIVNNFNVNFKFVSLEDGDYTAKTPVLPNYYSFMCSPRAISDLSSKISMGHIGSNVRKIINNAVFPVLMPSTVFKKWKSITAFFGGSKNSFKVLDLCRKISEMTNLPLNIFTFIENGNIDSYKDLLNEIGLLNSIEKGKINWIVESEGKFEDNLFSIPHDSLLVIGSFGHGIIKDLLFGSKMEYVQKNLPNNLLILGSNYEDI